MPNPTEHLSPIPPLEKLELHLSVAHENFRRLRRGPVEKRETYLAEAPWQHIARHFEEGQEREEHTLDADDFAATGPSPEEQVLRKLQWKEVLAGVAKMSQPRQAVFHDRHEKGLTTRETAEHLHMPLGTVQWHDQEILIALKRYFGTKATEEPGSGLPRPRIGSRPQRRAPSDNGDIGTEWLPVPAADCDSRSPPRTVGHSIKRMEVAMRRLLAWMFAAISGAFSVILGAQIMVMACNNEGNSDPAWSDWQGCEETFSTCERRHPDDSCIGPVPNVDCVFDSIESPAYEKAVCTYNGMGQIYCDPGMLIESSGSYIKMKTVACPIC